jgi:hypothetical protein
MVLICNISISIYVLVQSFMRFIIGKLGRCTATAPGLSATFLWHSRHSFSHPGTIKARSLVLAFFIEMIGCSGFNAETEQ